MDIDDDALVEPDEEEPKDVLLDNVKRLEEVQKLIKRDAHPDLAHQVSEAVQVARQRLRTAAPKPRRLQSLQLGIERKQQRIERLDHKLMGIDKELQGLETALEAKLESVRVEFTNRRLELLAQQAEVQAQREGATDLLLELRDVQNSLLPKQRSISDDLEVVARIANVLSSRMPQYTQAFQEFRAVAQA
eukprot:4956177-Amphidinium_carterae.2